MTFMLAQKSCSLPVLGGSDMTDVSDGLAGRSSFGGSASCSSGDAVSEQSFGGRSMMLSATACSQLGGVTSSFLQAYVEGFQWHV
jgi:hypothetical protein